ncbi:MBL fold metallo-hydrolase [Psychrobacillus sp. OK032]|uniref:MBL fold metallo-hydrolase n=1 Tax=Psychrobacillus sp. OK032 TaxID=1884358 RepID=UPI0008AC7476|nr:MBL fold metallo-hydrolase [Psychrobacillus sp. OK032]SES10374.1 Glyoxylase, beta-lactamase superfamily II [Psychrobacillus sp. OK032]
MIQYENETIRVFQSALYMTTSAVIELEEAIIITDPNWLPEEVEEIKEYVNQIKKDKQLYIIYTHSDFDHIIGSGAFPESKVIASRNLSENKHKENAMKQVDTFDQKYYLQRNYKPTYPRVDYIVSEDGQELVLGTSTVTFYLAPGHTDDGLFTVIEPAGIFLSGDYLSDVEFPFIFDSYLEYVKTMEKAKDIFSNHNIFVHVPGHGHTTENIVEMQNRLHFSQEYLEQLPNAQENIEEILLKRYTYFEGMKHIHEDNKKLAMKEKI